MVKFEVIAILLSVALLPGTEGENLCRPVLIIHGILEPADRLLPLAEIIRQAPDCPNGRNVTIIRECQVLRSFIPLWDQLKIFQRVMLPYFRDNPNGIHVISYSQGTLVARGVLEITDNHTVRSLFGIAGVQLGIAGFPLLQPNFLGINEIGKVQNAVDVSRICYNALTSKLLSFCDYWRDEDNMELYKKYNRFLPFINNEIPHPDAARYKRNLLTINKFVMVVTKNDEIVDPYQTGIFESRNANGTITEMEEQDIYKTDALGLRTLNEEGRLFRNCTSGLDHLAIPIDIDIIKTFILPHLD